MRIKGQKSAYLCRLLCVGILISCMSGICGATDTAAVPKSEKVVIVPAVIPGFTVDKKDYPVGPSLSERVLRTFTGGGGVSYVAQVKNFAAAPDDPTATVTLHPVDLTVTPDPGLTATPKPTVTVTPTATSTAKPTATPTVKATVTPTAVPTATPTAAPTATATPAPTSSGKRAANVVLEDDSDLVSDGSVHQDFAEEKYTDGLRIGTVTGNGVYLRKSPSSDGKKLDNLPKGTNVIVCSLADGWYKVTYKGTEGYMSSSYVTSSDEGTGKLGYGKVTGSVVNVRKKAGVSAESIGRLSEGTVVSVVGVSNGWYQVKTDSLEGYMHADYVSSISDTEASKAKKKDNGNSRKDSDNSQTSSGTSNDGTTGSKVQQILDIAADQLGIPYVWGGNTRSGFDCSGFVQYVFKQAGYSDFPRTHQYTAGTKVSYKELKAGDLVFFSNNGAGVGHVGIYVGNGNFIHAPRTGKNVSYSTLASGYYYDHFLYGARIINE